MFVKSYELLGEPFTVLRRNIEKDTVESHQRLLVRCDGIGSAGVAQVVNRTSGGTRLVTITCNAPEITFVRELIGYVPSETELLVVEVCLAHEVPSFNSSDPDSLRKRFGVLSNHVQKAVHHNGVSQRRAVGLAIGAAVVVGVALYAAFSGNEEDEKIQEQLAAVNEAIDGVVESATQMENLRKGWQNSVIQQQNFTQQRLDALRDITSLNEQRISSQEESGKIRDVLLGALERRTNEQFEAARSELEGLANASALQAALLAHTVNTTSAEFDNVYLQIQLNANYTYEAVENLRLNANKQAGLGVRRREETLQSLSALSTTVSNINTDRQTRNIVAAQYTDLFADSASRGFKPLTLIPTALPDPVAAEAEIQVETFIVVRVDDSGPGTHARFTKIRLNSRVSYIAETLKATETWKTIFLRLGDRCDTACTDAQCYRDSCGLWVEVQEGSCTLSPGLGTFWYDDLTEPLYSDWRSTGAPGGPNCQLDVVAYAPAQVVTNFTEFDTVLTDVCLGSGTPGGDFWLHAAYAESQFTIQSPLDPSSCDNGVLGVLEDLSTISVLFILTLQLGQVMSALQSSLLEMDRVVHGPTPAGATVLTNDIATLLDGGSGRCSYVSVIATKGAQPVYQYSRTGDVTATATVTASETTQEPFMPEETFTARLQNAADLNLANPQLIPDTFNGVGEVYLAAIGAAPYDVYDVPWTDLKVGLPQTVAGSPMYLLAPTEELFDNITQWTSLHPATLFDHNAAVVSADRFKSGIVINPITGDLACAPSGEAQLRSGGSICEVLDAAKWTEDGDVITVQPYAASYTMTIEIPDGEFVELRGSECPLISVTSRYAGGSRMVISSGSNGLTATQVRIRVINTTCAGVSQERFLMVQPGGIQSVVDLPACVRAVDLFREQAGGGPYVACSEVDLTSVTVEVAPGVGLFTGQDDSYVRAVAITVADEVTLATTELAQKFSEQMGELAALALSTVLGATERRIPAGKIGEWKDLVEKTQQAAVDQAELARGLRERTNISDHGVNTTEYFEKLAEKEREREIAKQESDQRFDDFDVINDAAKTALEQLFNDTEVLGNAIDSYLGNVTASGEAMKNLLKTLAEKSELSDFFTNMVNNLPGIGGKLLGLMANTFFGVFKLILDILTYIAMIGGIWFLVEKVIGSVRARRGTQGKYATVETRPLQTNIDY